MKSFLAVIMWATLVWLGIGQAALAQGLGSPSPFGGELMRGLTRITGKVICTTCTLAEVKAANPDMDKLYEFRNGEQRAVFLISSIGEFHGIQDASQLAYWQTVMGLTPHLVVRTGEDVWRRLTAEENLQKPVQLDGILRSTRALDVGELTFLEEPRAAE